MSDTERRLATVRTVAAINTIPDADSIDVATIDGWKVVVKKGEFEVGDLVVYFEIDSWIPATLAPFLFKGKTYNGVEGARLRTAKLRGQISQGLAMSTSIIPSGVFADEGTNLTEILQIQKWEPNIPANLVGRVRGSFPGFIFKTDQERIQNLSKVIQSWLISRDQWEVTEKLDGSSMTVYLKDDTFGVCSRNLDLAETDDNSFWKIARELDMEAGLHEIRTRFCYQDVAIQGELVGPGIQGNKYGLTKLQFFMYDAFDIRTASYIWPANRIQIADVMKLDHVPTVKWEANFEFISPANLMEYMIQLADGRSVVGTKPIREGLVFKRHGERRSFKVISNQWLLKNE